MFCSRDLHALELVSGQRGHLVTTFIETRRLASRGPLLLIFQGMGSLLSYYATSSAHLFGSEVVFLLYNNFGTNSSDCQVCKPFHDSLQDITEFVSEGRFSVF